MRNKLHFTSGLCLALLLSGCVTPSNINQSELAKEKVRYMSAGATGCLPADMEVEFIEPKWNLHGVWTIKCKSNVYVCSASGVDQNVASCSPLVK